MTWTVAIKQYQKSGFYLAHSGFDGDKAGLNIGGITSIILLYVYFS